MAEYIAPKNVRFEKDEFGKDHLCFSTSGEKHNHTLSNPIFPFQWDESQRIRSFGQVDHLIIRPEKYKKEKDRYTVNIHLKDCTNIYIQCDDISGLTNTKD